MRALLFVLASFCLVAACGDAQQDGRLLRVAWVAVEHAAGGAERPHSEGVHYIEAGGRHRHDETRAAGASTSLYRFPGEGVTVAVDHALRSAVRSRFDEPPWDGSTSGNSGLPPRFGFAGQAADGNPVSAAGESREIGVREHGPLRLTGYAWDAPGLGRMETWMYVHPGGDTNLLGHPPIPIETSIAMPNGNRFEARVVTARLVPADPALFEIPYPLSAGEAR